MQIEIDMVALARDHAQEKAVITAALERLVGIERKIIAAVAFVKSEGSETFDRASELGTCKLVLKQPIYTKVDADAWPKLRAKLPAKHPARAIFRTTFALRMPEARALQDAKDEISKQAWRDVADVITRTPGKVSVSVEKLALAPIDPAKRVGVIGPKESP